MLKISKYKEILLDFKDNISGIEEFFTARTEEELKRRIKEIDHFFLIGIIPSANTDEKSFDNISENDTIILYVIKPIAERDRDNDDTTLQEEAQDIISEIKKRLYTIADNYDHALHQTIRQINFGTMQTDPEYNYMGCDGYSLSFILKSNWF